ncbi:hypothetical protein HPB49_019459 [Dermacentor silvarum]|uniref:Uncharacterized protein n=1 Tax=Dermacentor silvarum TaxID=543639 RepID=A0ACB8CM32_DERSI|nr:hypothetical protein HPB49_019459 [Dermacentor silvarum]
MKGCSPALRVFLKDRSCKKLSTLAQHADCFLEAQDICSLSKDKSYKDNGEISRQTESTKRPPRGHTQCFLCNNTGHRASECWSRTRNSPSATGWSSGKTGSPGETGKTQERRQASCMLSTEETRETGGHQKKEMLFFKAGKPSQS